MLLTTGNVQVMILVAGISKAGYYDLLAFSTSLALLPYLLSSLYAVRSAWNGVGFEDDKVGVRYWNLCGAGPAALHAGQTRTTLKAHSGRVGREPCGPGDGDRWADRYHHRTADPLGLVQNLTNSIHTMINQEIRLWHLI